MAAPDIKSPEAHALLTTATKGAMKKSGAKFFKSTQQRSTDFLDLVADVPFLPEEFKDVEDVLTLENLVLLARYYAGQITKAKRKRTGVDTLHDKVMKLIGVKRSVSSLTSSSSTMLCVLPWWIVRPVLRTRIASTGQIRSTNALIGTNGHRQSSPRWLVGIACSIRHVTRTGKHLRARSKISRRLMCFE
jgi:hypothetical protein